MQTHFRPILVLVDLRKYSGFVVRQVLCHRVDLPHANVGHRNFCTKRKGLRFNHHGLLRNRWHKIRKNRCGWFERGWSDVLWKQDFVGVERFIKKDSDGHVFEIIPSNWRLGRINYSKQFILFLKPVIDKCIGVFEYLRKLFRLQLQPIRYLSMFKALLSVRFLATCEGFKLQSRMFPESRIIVIWPVVSYTIANSSHALGVARFRFER